MIRQSRRHNATGRSILIDCVLALLTFLLVAMETSLVAVQATPPNNAMSRDVWMRLCVRHGRDVTLDRSTLGLDVPVAPMTSPREALTRIKRHLRDGRNAAKKLKQMLVSERLLDTQLARSLELKAASSISHQPHPQQGFTAAASAAAVSTSRIVERLTEATNQVARATIDVRQLGHSEKKFDHYQFGPRYARLQQRLCIVYWELLQYVTVHNASITPTKGEASPKAGGVAKSGVSKGGAAKQKPAAASTVAKTSSGRFTASPVWLNFEADYLLTTVDPAVRYVRDYMVLSNVHRLLYLASRSVHVARNDLRRQRERSKAKAKVKVKDIVQSKVVKKAKNGTLGTASTLSPPRQRITTTAIPVNL